MKSSRDFRILVALAELEDINPQYLLEILCKQTGDVCSWACCDQQGLPPMVRNALRQRYNAWLKKEEEIVERCREESKGLIIFVGKIALICMSVLYIFYLLSN